MIFAFAIFILVMWKVWTEFTSDELNEDLWSKTSQGVSIKSNTQRAFDNLDWISVLVYFALHIGIIVLVFLLRSHPVVYIAGLFFIVILVMIAAPLSNAWEETIQDDDLVDQISNIPKLNFLMGKLPLFEMLWGFMTLVMFAAFARGEDLI